jgi:hypothetical protein
MRFLLLLLALLPVAAVAQIETPGTGGGGGGGGGTSTPYYGPFTNTQIYGVNTNALRISSGVITSSLPAIDISQTWSNSGVTFTGLVFSIVNTASSNRSSALQVLTNGVPILQLQGSGQLIVKPGTKANPAIVSTNYNVGATPAGIYFGSGSQDDINFSHTGANRFRFMNGVFALGSGSAVAWSDNAETDAGTRDLFLYRDGTAALQLGADAATATPQTIKAHDGSGSDKSAADMTIATGKSTGAGTGGNLKFKTSFPDAAGSSLNGYQTRYAFSPNRFSLSDAVASTIFSVDNLTSGKIVGIEVFITTYARNGNDAIVNNDVAVISAFNDGAGIVTSVSASNVTNSLATLNSMTTEITAIDNGGGGVGVQVKPTIGVSGWSIYCIYQARVNTDAFVDVNSD